jgi:trigger factor
MDDSRVTLEELTPIRKRLQVEVPAGAVQAELDRTYRELGQRARLPGFRPGRAPRAVLERTFGDDVRREVLGRLVEHSFHHAVEAHRLAVVGTPDIDVEGLVPGEALRYSATVEVRPAIDIGDLAGLEAVRPASVVTDADVERLLESMRESVAQLRPIEDRNTVESGDVVTVDLTSRLEGGEPTRREGVHLEAGGGTLPLALERQLVGQHRGARLSLQVPFPPDYANAGLAGKTVDFEVDIKDLRAKELPPLDDDFARDHARCDSLAELRVRLRADLERDAAARAEDAVRDALLGQALARHSFEVPPSLVDRRVETMMLGMGMRLPDGPAREEALSQVTTQLRPRAEQQIRAELLLDAFAAREEIAVGEDEVSGEIAALAAREGRAPEQLRALYERPEARAALRARLVRERALMRLVDRARIMPSTQPESVAHEK